MDRYRVKPKQKVKLADWDADEKSAFDGTKGEAKEKTAELVQKLGELQDILFAEHKHKILVVLQAMDTGGKDGTIRAVFNGIDPQGIRVANFKAPTTLELDHDYLWRIHQQVPGKGEIVIFNRSQYEDVLVVRVHSLVPATVWKKRYDQINAFEKMLVEEGTTIIKVYLHINQEEQRLRLLERIDIPEKRWKFNPGDLKERERWGDYTEAYQDMLTRTSTSWAPWYIVPANRNWYRNLVVATILHDQLKRLKMKYPADVENIEQYRPLLGGEKTPEASEE